MATVKAIIPLTGDFGHVVTGQVFEVSEEEGKLFSENGWVVPSGGAPLGEMPDAEETETPAVRRPVETTKPKRRTKDSPKTE